MGHIGTPGLLISRVYQLLAPPSLDHGSGLRESTKLDDMAVTLGPRKLRDN
jgi:hypothetical protein